jgi:hypothetical protein
VAEPPLATSTFFSSFIIIIIIIIIIILVFNFYYLDIYTCSIETLTECVPSSKRNDLPNIKKLAESFEEKTYAAAKDEVC